MIILQGVRGMVKKKDKYCPHCNKKWLLTVPIRARLKKNGFTNVKCIGCGEWFTITNGQEDQKSDG